ncbi:hypothetical protein [Methanosaeta sp. UBA458]|uniref:hypothetical protein n=1 Tax=Methanosaeta sp. UBA458 TaxID=1915561 RepID=UPI00257DA888|nr:hypothetical protein [Methanosaeta sp. UBA458]
MPVFVKLKGNVRLTRSKKGDCYYTITTKDCSCKAQTLQSRYSLQAHEGDTGRN